MTPIRLNGGLLGRMKLLALHGRLEMFLEVANSALFGRMGKARTNEKPVQANECSMSKNYTQTHWKPRMGPHSGKRRLSPTHFIFFTSLMSWAILGMLFLLSLGYIYRPLSEYIFYAYFERLHLNIEHQLFIVFHFIYALV